MQAYESLNYMEEDSLLTSDEIAIREASARRLRPILMTSLATVTGAIPLALSHGAGAGARSAIGVVIVFGVTIATAITLYIVPPLYRWLAPYTSSPQTISRLLRKLMRAQPKGAIPAPLPAE